MDYLGHFYLINNLIVQVELWNLIFYLKKKRKLEFILDIMIKIITMQLKLM